MTTLLEERDLWDEGLETVREGEVRTWDERIVDLQSLISRRWGWPKSAASAAKARLKYLAREAGEEVLLYVGNDRWKQQRDLIHDLPDLARVLCSGLAGGASREIPTASRELDMIIIRFDARLTDDGLTKGVLRGIAGRLGCTLEELRSITQFTNNEGTITLDVNASDLR